MAAVIGEVRVAPGAVRPWEPVRIEVLGPDGRPPDGDVEVWIDRTPGAAQWLQLPAGRHEVAVLARRGGDVEHRSAVVEVSGEPVVHAVAPGDERPAVLTARPNPARSHEATISLAAFAPGRRAPGDARPPRWERRLRLSDSEAADLRRRLGGDPGRRTVRRRVAGSDRTVALELGTREPWIVDQLLEDLGGRADRPPLAPRYVWSFGDGTTATTAEPVVVHDYSRVVDLRLPSTSWDVRCRVERTGEELEVVRTLVIDSWYAACRARGTIICPVEGPALADVVGTTAIGRFRVDNPEDEALTFDRMAVVALVDDERTRRPVVRTLEEPVVVDGGSSTAVAAVPDLSDLPSTAFGYSVHLVGVAADGTPARATAYLELPLGRGDGLRPTLQVPALGRDTWPWDEVAGRARDRMARRADRGGVPLEARDAPAVLVDRSAGLVSIRVPGSSRAIEALGGVRGLDDVLAASVGGLVTTRAGSFPETGPVAAGELCNPENLSPSEVAQAEASSLACTVAEQATRRTPGRFVNARKGDIVLSAAGVSPMAQLYHDLEPPQLHSHAGIMTRNHDQIAHCVGSGAWLEARLARTSEEKILGQTVDLPDPDLDAIRFGWPGAVLQHTEDAVEGEVFTDPEGAEFTISGIQPHDIAAGGMRLVSPFVVKPDPLLETAAVRAPLLAAADDAAAASARPGRQSQVHFSFFTFTDATFSTPAPATPDGAFPAGTRPGACSTFIWSVLRGRGVRFEQGDGSPSVLESTDLETPDRRAGAALVPGGGVDGLYQYDVDERVRAGTRMKARMVHAVNESHWGPDALTSGAAGALVDLFLNMIASNRLEIGERWREEPTIGHTVSPDDMQFWDGPDRGGSYGFVEPLRYRQPRTEVVDLHRWTEFERTHRVSGRVLHEGNPVARATVTCAGFTTHSDVAGGFDFDGVPEAPQRIRVTAAPDLSGESDVFVPSGDVFREVNVLAEVDERFRRVRVDAAFVGVDDEVHANEVEVFEETRFRSLTPERTQVALPEEGDEGFLTFRWGGECRAEFEVELHLEEDLSVRVELRGRFFEGSYEGTKDLESEFDGFLVVRKDSSDGVVVTLPAEDGSTARLDLRIFNAIDPIG